MNVLITQEHRDAYRPGDALIRQMLAARKATLANKLRPVIRQHKRHAEYCLEQAASVYLNARLVQFTAPGQEIILTDCVDAYALVAVYCAWDKAYRPEWARLTSNVLNQRRRFRGANDDRPIITDETLCWLLHIVWEKRSGYKLGAFTPQAEANIQRCTISPEDVAHYKKELAVGTSLGD